jgi:uncharacterized protein (TIGR01777 family)
MRILITGAAGSVSRVLTPYLLAAGHHVTGVSRNRAQTQPLAHPNYCRTLWRDLSPGYLLANRFDAIINLAGAPMMQRWNKRNKDDILRSRLSVTNRLCNLIRLLPGDARPECILHASSVAIYGDRRLPVDEYDLPQGTTRFFQALVWRKLEELQRQQRIPGVRNIIARLGVVIGPSEMLQAMLRSSRCHMGVVLGSGQQRISWVSHRDMARAFEYLLQHRPCSGTYHIVAPDGIDSRQMSNGIAACVNRVPHIRIPKLLLHCLLGELATNFLTSAQVRPGRLLESNFEWELPEFDSAVRRAALELKSRSSAGLAVTRQHVAETAR